MLSYNSVNPTTTKKVNRENRTENKKENCFGQKRKEMVDKKEVWLLVICVKEMVGWKQRSGELEREKRGRISRDTCPSVGHGV